MTSAKAQPDITKAENSFLLSAVLVLKVLYKPLHALIKPQSTTIPQL